MEKEINAQVISVFPNKVRISVDRLEDFQLVDEKLKVGSYLRIADTELAIMIAIIENFTIEVTDNGQKKYIIEANPLGIIRDNKFERGGDTIAIPPTSVEPAKQEEIQKIFDESLEDSKKFKFSKLSTNQNISVPVDGNKFFNKHIAVVGSTGSGKSHSVAKIIQEAVYSKENEYDGLNNSHIIIFDIHSEYRTAFPDANMIDVSSLVLPYWLLNSDELQELFLDTEANDHNQRNVFKQSIITSRKDNFTGEDDIRNGIHLDSPLYFDINDILTRAIEKNTEMVPGANNKTKAGPLNGKLSNYVSRLESKISDKRLDFLLGDAAKKITFEKVIAQLIGYDENKSNVTILDLSGVPFEVLSITVSLISRIMFEYGYYYKRLRLEINPEETCNNDVPLLLVYEEAHKYIPNSDLAKYRASRQSIERIAKEGRKYGISLLLASQRPSEISETIFSQCSNFLALRLTNPNDQNYVKRLLPDTLGSLIDKMPSLRAGECLLIGDAVTMPSVVQLDRCEPEPSSNDIPYYELWKKPWIDLEISEIKEIWYR
ncbi:ATP-binding protein [Listeria ivanovii]|uniref:ATP-binding protein n=1 Tax=Listeria ivanovii TaxID=1638 RepID=UPI0021AD5659|nr:ATP-binding protein [Listeria ivanovii]